MNFGVAQECVMNSDPEQGYSDQGLPPPVERLLSGLWRQREELGLIADELLDLFRQHGLKPPQDDQRHA
jgi:hypothetical protein